MNNLRDFANFCELQNFVVGGRVPSKSLPRASKTLATPTRLKLHHIYLIPTKSAEYNYITY